MHRFIRLSILPVIGLLFLLTACLWCRRELNLRLFGQPTEGHLIGMVLQRENHADILAALDTRLVLTLANGDRIDATFSNYAFVRAAYHFAEPGKPGRELRKSDLEKAGGGVSATLRQTIHDAVRGDADIVRWSMLRESRRANDPIRVVRIEKTELVRGFFGVPKVPEVFGLQDGLLVLNEDGSASSHVGTARIHAVFDRSNESSVTANKGESLTVYEYERNGQPITPAKKNFFLNAEPYKTQFRPVFAFQANGKSVARLSHIGRHGGPTLALSLYGPCRVFYDPQQPEQAVVTALPGPVDGKPLAWFSRLCEGVFGQWGSAALIAIAGLLFITTGLLFIHLALFPPKVESGIT